MNNIYEVWEKFNKKQENLKGPEIPQWLSRIEKRTSSWQNQSYPKGEYWKYVKYGDLETTRLQSASAQESLNVVESREDGIQIYLNNFSDITDIKSAVLPEGLEIYTHRQVMESKELSEKIKPLLKDKDEKNSLSEVPYSFFGLGLFIVVDPSFKLSKSLRIIFDLNNLNEKDAFVPFSVQMLVGEGAKATLFLETKADQFVGFSNIRFDSFLSKFSELNVYYKESGGSQSRTMNHNFINIEEGARLSFFDLTLPGQWSRHNTIASLSAVNAHATLNGVYLNKDKNFCDHHTEIKHLKKHTTSEQNYKGILADSSRAVFNGKVFIEKMARKSASEQINKNLMLSPKAEIDTKPELEIYNDDVKAAHGATIGKIDDEQLFYLQSRGYSKSAAWRVLAQAFVYDSLEDANDQVKLFYQSDMLKALSQFKDI